MTAQPTLTAAPAVRTLVVWCPQWSVEAARRSLGADPPELLALVAKGKVVAASPAAHQESVTAGLRLREAQTRCPDLTVLPHDPAIDERWFTPVVRAVERVVPHVHLLRQGCLAIRIAGAARFYGDEDAVVELLLDQLAELGLEDVRLAVADGLFAAEQAAYATTSQRPVLLLPSRDTTAFLRTLSVTTVAAAVDQPGLATLLQRMGIRSLGAFAKLPRAQVHTRFGAAGRRAHQLAWGEDAPVLPVHEVPDDLTTRTTCDPCDDSERLTELCRPQAHTLAERLRTRSLVTHEIRVTLTTDRGRSYERSWRHAWPFTTHDMVERVRWQLEDLAAQQQDVHDGVVAVEIGATTPTPAAAHAQGLWGERPDQHITHAVTSLQHDLGHAGVRIGSIIGGRLLHERTTTRPWGDAPPVDRLAGRPWPGALPGPQPATVFETAQPAIVRSGDDTEVTIDARGNLSAPPGFWRPAHDRSRLRRIVAWNGPWPIRQHWWQEPSSLSRFQVVDDADEAWLLLRSGDGWWIEARYD
ncbi:DNA polymerase Y family protein [Calidifontibacter terrae]